jgi:hypothetical protein
MERYSFRRQMHLVPVSPSAKPKRPNVPIPTNRVYQPSGPPSCWRHRRADPELVHDAPARHPPSRRKITSWVLPPR